MRVLLFGVTGFTGGNLARELIGRGHEVLGVARTHHRRRQIPDGVIAVAANIFDEDAVAALAEDVDVIAVAVAPLTDDGPLSDAVPGLLAVAEQRGARLGIVGGASSLLRTPDGPRIFDDGFPEEWKPGAQALIDTLEALRASETPVDWFVLSPAENYGSYVPGERTRHLPHGHGGRGRRRGRPLVHRRRGLRDGLRRRARESDPPPDAVHGRLLTSLTERRLTSPAAL